MAAAQDGVTIMRPTTLQRRGYKQEAFESHFESKFERLKVGAQNALSSFCNFAMQRCIIKVTFSSGVGAAQIFTNCLAL